MSSKGFKADLSLRNLNLKRPFIIGVYLFCFLKPVFAQSNNHFLEKAENFEKQGFYEKAKKEIDSYFKLNQDHSEAHLTRYRIYFKLGLSKQERDTDLDIILAQALVSFKEAKKTALQNKALTDFFSQEESNFILQSLNKGSDAYNSGNFSTAIIWFDLILDYLPNHKTSRELKLFSLYEIGDAEDFIKEADSYLSDFGFNAEIAETVLDYCTENQIFQPALEWAESLEHHLKNNEKSTSLDVLLRFHSKSGLFYLSKNNFTESAFHFKKMLDLTDDEWYRITLARVYSTQKKRDDAQFYLDQVNLSEISSLDILDYFVSVQQSVNRLHPKKEFDKSTLKLSGKLAWISPYFQGKWWFDEKNYEKAALEIQKTIDLNSEFKPALELQGKTYIQLGLEKQSDELLTQALIYLKAAFRIDPKDDELKMLIQELEK